jgi:hypothetical protein
MSKQKKIIIAVIIAVILLTAVVIYSLPRVMACYLYYSLTSKPLALETLSIKPQKIELPQPTRRCVFSLGYAESPLCPDSIYALKCTKGTGLTCKADLNSITYFFLLPNRSPEVDVIAKYSIYGIKDYYSLQLKIAEATPKSYSEIFFSKPSDSVLYVMLLALFKAEDIFNQNGLGIFESDNIKGFIRFGAKENPCAIQAEVFSKDGKITQCIEVVSESPEKSKNSLLSLLSSYRFILSDIPDVNILDNIIISQLSNNDKFEIEEPK